MIDSIETTHLILRKAREDDLEAIWQNVWRDEQIAKTMLWKPTKTREEAVERMRKTLGIHETSYAYFVCLKSTDEPIGFAGIKQTVPGEFEETGICIAHDYQNLGYGKETPNALIDLAFRCLHGHRFLYGCFHENTRSAALCKSCGFTYSHSEPDTRKWDQYEYLCDFYILSSSAQTPTNDN